MDVRRYGRIINKAALDLLDRKFAKSTQLRLQQADARLTKEYVKPAEKAARNGDLTEAALKPMFKLYRSIIRDSKRSPSAQVLQLHAHPCALILLLTAVCSAPPL